ncbi:hypothetical protein TIFTF001_020517 [Ficus carica]|uniref:RNase H type-1 domain-containing protein n=1 Tax=Ficus carica TaxID=3494 RepID=A0AA88AIL3_FICCA|nr:hypothetical protein TIFTF001_020517 [Ficus carica]
MNDVYVQRALVDTGSSVNVIPLTILTAVEIPRKRITKWRRPWLNKHKLICSTYHQCVKGRLGARVIRIPANQTPFDQTKGHFVDAEYYDNFATASEESIVPESGEENESCSCSEEVSSNSIPSEVQPNLAPKRMQDGAGSVVEPLEEVDLSDDPNGHSWHKKENVVSNNLFTMPAAFLTGLVTVKDMGIRKLKVLGDSNLVERQMDGGFAIREPILAPYQTMAQRVVKQFDMIIIERTPRSTIDMPMHWPHWVQDLTSPKMLQV